MKELPTRIAVAVIGIPILILCIWHGGKWFFSLIVLITVVGQYELYILAEVKSQYPQKTAGLILSFALLNLIGYGFQVWWISLALFLFLYILAAEMFRNVGSALMNTAITLFGVVYPGLFLGALLYIRLYAVRYFGPLQPDAAAIFVLMLFVSIWICDTLAYFVGVNLGRHRLFPRVSPRKSIEGGVAGLIGGIVTFLAAGWLGLLDASWTFLLICGTIVGVLGQLGDLVESWLKRDAEVKDSSNILPGHGGFLDRFDSVSFISPAILIALLLWEAF